ncbi:MAG TPA: type ISP restriction/modification enzyme [Pseudorhodoplanes sp.]|nr:type ISP restriction/modification enzyme [Pseudorhodoplanes sp.]
MSGATLADAAFRSFDRQWLPPDNRLMSRPRPDLWTGYSPEQTYLTCLDAYSPENGAAITFTNLIPDHDLYKGSFVPLANNRAFYPASSVPLQRTLLFIRPHPEKHREAMRLQRRGRPVRPRGRGPHPSRRAAPPRSSG